MWQQELIGKPWKSGARGPLEFDCWGLVRWVYRERLGVILPALPGLDAKDVGAVARSFVEIAPSWLEIPRPENLCAVAMSTGKRIHHVGVWLDEGRGVLHAMEKSCVVFQNLQSLRAAGFQTIRYYKLP